MILGEHSDQDAELRQEECAYEVSDGTRHSTGS